MSFTTFFADKPRVAAKFDRNTLLYALVGLHVGIAAMIGLQLGNTTFIQTTGPLMVLGTTLTPLFLLVLMFWHFVYLAIVVRPARPIHRFAADLRGLATDPSRLLNGTLSMMAVIFFFSSFSYVKDQIPHIQPFIWDSYFAQLDRSLHFGRLPHKWLMPVLGTPLITTVLNAAYHLWFFIMYFLLFMASFDQRSRAASVAFLFAMVLCFALGGNVLAIVFSSAGPVYYQEMGFGPDYVALVDTLHRFNEISPIWALDVQEKLLDSYYSDGAVKGISAMPSMHVSSTVVMTCYLFTWRRWAGWLMVGFSALILLGSVQLAWHYAVDGYLAILVALGCWWLSCRLSNRLLPTAEPRPNRDTSA